MTMRTAPLMHAVRALASALGIALVLEATGLVTWAERLEVGVLRNIAQPVTQAWERGVTAVHLDQPRRLALDLRARWSDRLIPVADADAAAENPPSAADTASARPGGRDLPPTPRSGERHPKKMRATPATQPVTSQSTTRSASPSATLPARALPAMQVALVGDSMMAVGLAPVLRRKMGNDSQVRFVRAYRSGTGLGRPDVFNWPLQYPQLVGTAHPGWVICAIGANDAQNFQVDRTVYVFGTPAWKQVYAERVREFAHLLTRNGTRVLWIGMPVMRESSFSRRIASINGLVKDVLKEFPQVTWVDPNPYIAGEGGSFQQYLRDQHGKLVRLRADDGIHLSEEGAAYLVPTISGWMQRTATGT